MRRSRTLLRVLTATILMTAAFPVGAAGPDAVQQIEMALKAAPPAIAETATVVDHEGNVLREGSGEWTCMAIPEAMCLDAVWLKWAEAWTKKEPFTTDRIGLAYMLDGDAIGASNIDPYAETPTADNQWVIEGPHVMLIVPDPAQLEGLPDTPVAEGPYVMWKGTPYAHIMMPVAARPAQ